MVGQKHESGHNRAAPSSIRTGNAIRHICRSGKEGKDDLPRRRQQRDRRIRSLCQPVHQRRLYPRGPGNAPRKSLIEYSPTLGTTPRSHMCVRNATSHAKFVYDWAPVNELLFSFLIKKSYLCATLFNLMLLRICLYLFLLFLPANYTTTRSSSPLIPADPAAAMSSVCRQLYADMQLDSMVDYTAFEQAITGAQAIERRNKDIVTLIDFTKPSTEERLYVLDIRHKRLLFSSLVSHGKNSGEITPLLSPTKSILTKSSLGFFVTENTYQNKNGYSLV